MASKSPLAVVKERFGDKSKLVEAVKAFMTDELWLNRTSTDRGRTKGLEHVSNAKLLRLHLIFSEVQASFGTRAKLVDALVDVLNRSKDAGFRTRLEQYPIPRLYDLYKSSQKRAKAAASKAGAVK